MEGGGLDSKLEIRKNTLKPIFRHKLAPKIDYPPRISIGVSLKQSAWFVSGLSVINNQIPINQGNA